MEVRHISTPVDPVGGLSWHNHPTHLLLWAGMGHWRQSCCGAGMEKGIWAMKRRGRKAGVYSPALLGWGWRRTGWPFLKPSQKPSADVFLFIATPKEIKGHCPKKHCQNELKAFPPNAIVWQNIWRKNTRVERKRRAVITSPDCHGKFSSGWPQTFPGLLQSSSAIWIHSAIHIL